MLFHVLDHEQEEKLKKKKKAVHAAPKAVRKRMKHRHKWTETARYAFNDGGTTRYHVYLKCVKRGCPDPVDYRIEPKRRTGTSWWRR